MSPTAEPTISRGKTRVLAGITVIDTPLITRAMDYARTHSEPFLFNHAVRSWLFAARLGQLQGISYDAEVVAVSTLLHDVGLTKNFTGPRRFEIEGADAARAFAREQGLEDRRVQLIWDTVALNSTPSIALYKEAEVALCTAGIALDYGGLQYDQIAP
ncbi:MAG TPA: HD domain-containing protein, partial [Blastocatellia bacterium]|nr:HD domain-containing protein [Blastocatellia bacterium]